MIGEAAEGVFRTKQGNIPNSLKLALNLTGRTDTQTDKPLLILIFLLCIVLFIYLNYMVSTHGHLPTTGTFILKNRIKLNNISDKNIIKKKKIMISIVKK